MLKYLTSSLLREIINFQFHNMMDTKYCATSAIFRFQRKYHQTSPKLQILTVFWSEYILKSDVVFDDLPATSYAKFIGPQEHPKAVIVLYGLAH